jgi:small multidrug resistance pump
MRAGSVTSTFHRRLFQLAAIYNGAFFVWTALAPGHFFRLAGAVDAEPFEYLWQCLGMVIGVYGLLYWHASRHLDTSRAIIAVGLLGKVLGPIGWAWSFGHGNLAAGSFLVIVANDLIWWPGFASYLLRDRSERERQSLLAIVMLATHAAGALLLALATGLGLPRSDEQVAPVLWTLAWSLWCLADVFSGSFVRGLLWRRAPDTAARLDRLLTILIAAAAASDLALNACYAALVRPTTALHDPTLRFLSLTVTNGLFLAAYLLLSRALWQKGLPRWLSLLGVPGWLGAFGLCLCGCGLLPGSEPVFAGVFATFFCAWLAGLLFTDRA